jgi:hypothetical protein
MGRPTEQPLIRNLFRKEVVKKSKDDALHTHNAVFTYLEFSSELVGRFPGNRRAQGLLKVPRSRSHKEIPELINVRPSIPRHDDNTYSTLYY